MMTIAVAFNFGPVLAAKESTGSMWVDMFQFINNLTMKRTADLGILIMLCAGFAKYMDRIGASKAMVNLAATPLSWIKSPFAIVCGGFLVGQVLHLFIPSASGLGLLLMVTLFPLYLSVGLSRTTATAVIATNGCLDLGPNSGNTVLAAKYAGLTPIEYFIQYQLAVAIAISLVMTVVHYFVAKHYAPIDALDEEEQNVKLAAEANKKEEDKKVPLFYAFLPMVPLIFVMDFGYFKFGGIKMDLNVAIFLSLMIAMICEFIRSRDLKVTLGSIQTFFDGMGVQFAAVVTLIVAGETFAKGLTSLGAIDTLIHSAEMAGLGKDGMIFVMSAIIMICSFVMGSGNAPFFAFAAFAPDIAKKLGVEAVNVLLPMQLTASVTRAMSPITAVVVAVSGVAGVSPFKVVKRTAFPLAAGLIVIQIMTFLMF